MQEQHADTSTIRSTSSPNSSGLNIDQRMQLALNAVLNKGETPTCAARKWQLQRSAILQGLLREKKRQRYLINNVVAGCKDAIPRKQFQSKFTSNQLLSAQQEENLANYLKQCYEMQWQHITNENTHPPHSSTLPKPPLLSEEVARSFTHNFVHMNKLKYPRSWDAKQQAATDWFNGFVDRNPEVIEYVATSTRERKQRKRFLRSHFVKSEGGESEQNNEDKFGIGHNDMSEDDMDIKKSDNDNNIEGWPPGLKDITFETACNPAKASYSAQSSDFRIKVEPTDGGHSLDNVERNKMHNAVMDGDNNNTDIMIPEIIYHTATKNTLDQKESDNLPAESIAESVKRRSMRKPRMLTEHLYAAEMTMDTERIKQRNQMFAIKKLTTDSNTIKINKVQTYFQKNEGIDTKEEAHVPNHYSIIESLHDLKESIEKMHSDMNYFQQSILMEMGENNRLLRRVVTTSENKN